MGRTGKGIRIMNEEVLIGSEVTIQVGRFKSRAIVLGKNEFGSYVVRTLAKQKTIVAQRILSVHRAPLHQAPRTLLNIAFELLQKRGVATAGELAQQILQDELWKPTKGGKTPRLTLYSLLYLDAKKKTPHVQKIEDGKWRWIG